MAFYKLQFQSPHEHKNKTKNKLEECHFKNKENMSEKLYILTKKKLKGELLFSPYCMKKHTSWSVGFKKCSDILKSLLVSPSISFSR